MISNELTANETIDVQSRITGRVKWFNNKAGFGFVTACDGELKDKDIFVHYSSINVPDDQYKYFSRNKPSSVSCKLPASNVSVYYSIYTKEQ